MTGHMDHATVIKHSVDEVDLGGNADVFSPVQPWQQLGSTKVMTCKHGVFTVLQWMLATFQGSYWPIDCDTAPQALLLLLLLLLLLFACVM